MSKKLNNILYEEFHGETQPLKELPKRNNFTYGSILLQIDQLIENRTKLNILDLGCGPGSISFYLINKGHNVTGVDLSELAIKSCKETKKIHNFSKGMFINESVEKYILRSRKKFDLIIMSELIEHLTNDKVVLKNIKKLLNKKGKIFITTPSLKAPLYRMGLMNSFDKRVGHIRRYSIKSLSIKVKSAGYKIISIKKTEGVLRNSVFNIKGLGWIVRISNKFLIVGKIITFLDTITLKLFGESDIQLVVVKI